MQVIGLMKSPSEGMFSEKPSKWWLCSKVLEELQRRRPPRTKEEIRGRNTRGREML